MTIIGMCDLAACGRGGVGTVPRWRIEGYPIIIGGGVGSAEEWAELAAHGATHCASATNPPDSGVPEGSLQFHVDDDGTPFPEERLEQVVQLAARCFAGGGVLYLHCWVGASRSPSFAYAVLRAVRGLTPEQAAAAIQASYPYRPTFGVDPKHKSYIAGIESWLAKRSKPRRIMLQFGPYCLSTRGGFDFSDHEGDVRGRTGSEHGFIRMGEELHKLGHHVALCTLPLAGTKFPAEWRGLQLVDYADRKDEEWDAVVSWNEAEPLRGMRAKALAVSLQINTVVGDVSGIEVDAWLSPSEPHRQRLQQHGGRWEVVPDGVDLEPLDALAKQERKVPGRVVWTSSPDRGLHWLLSAWPAIKKAVPHASLKVFYEYRSWLEHMKRVPAQYTAPDMLEQIRRAAYIEASIPALSRMGVEFCGATPRRDVERELVRAECLAYSCDTVLWSEGYSCSLMEACAARSCPVATDCDAFPDIYGGTLPLVPLPLSKNGEQFAGTVVAALTDLEFRSGVNARARALAEKNTWAEAARRMAAVLESVLQGKK